VGGQDVVYVETTHPHDRVLDVTWQLDGRTVPNANRRSFRLAEQALAPGLHRLTATLTDPANPGSAAQTLAWSVDNTLPAVTFTLAAPETSVVRPDGSRHFFVRDSFTMRLEPSDDQPGYVVAEFRVNSDGWHHYYGWPDAPPDTPFLFTPRGTTIKELVYGSLSAEGLSPQPWEERTPGWGTHTFEYRARDAAGNIGNASEFRATVMPSADCTSVVTGEHAGALVIRDSVTCLDGATIGGPVTVAPGASLIASSATIRGDVTVADAMAVELVGTTVEGSVDIRGTTASLILFGSTMRDNVLLANNRTGTAPTVAGNRIGATLRCESGDVRPANLGVPNTVGDAADQCTT
jgi:hypothetical protein